MDRIVVFILLLCLSLAGCKTGKSHVQRTNLDSLVHNRELSNIGISAVSAREQITALWVDSNWSTGINLVNFNGQLTVVSNQLRADGTAEKVTVRQSGETVKAESVRIVEKDSLSGQLSSETNALTQIKKKEVKRQKETKGIRIPWYIWLIAVGAVSFLLYGIYNRIKSKLKLF